MRIASFAAVGLLAAAGVAACNPVNPYAALVNGSAVTQAQLNQEIDAVRGSPQYVSLIEQSGTSVSGQGSDTANSQFVADILTRDVAYVLVHQELARRHVHVTSKDVTLGRQALSTQIPASVQSELPAGYRAVLVQRNAEVIALERSLAGPPPGPAAVAAYYQAHKSDFVQICARHILVGSQAEAAALKGQIAAGADFATVAGQNSTDSSTATQGGDLGCAASRQFSGAFGPAVAQAVESAPLNQVVGPVQSQYGWHLFEVGSRTQQTLQQATATIQQQLQGSGQTAMQALLRHDLQTASVNVNPRYGHFALAAGQAAVVPPALPVTRSDQGGSPPTTTPPGGAPAP